MAYDKEYTPDIVPETEIEHDITKKLWRNIYIWMALGLGLMAVAAFLYVRFSWISAFLQSHMLFIFIGSLAVAFLIYMNFSLSSTMSALAIFSSYTAFILLGS